MMNDTESDQFSNQSDLVYQNKAWVQANGGWVHSNNVLFYFMSSPFFDPTSENQQLLSQYGGTPLEMEVMGNKSRMEFNLRNRRGLSYVVAHDPLESRTVVDGQPSNVWVIRKQVREQPDTENVKVLAYYFIANETIFEAPSAASVLSYRMLNTTTSLNKLFSEACQFPIFSAAHGHTYVKPTQKTTTQAQPISTQQAKEATPAPNTQTLELEKVPPISNHESAPVERDAKVIYDALQMTLRYGKEYADETPLLGEPGSFRFSRSKEGTITSTTAGLQSLAQPQTSRLGTPSHSRAPSIVPVVSSISSVQAIKPVEKNSQVQDIPLKPKRRKSKAGDSSL